MLSFYIDNHETSDSPGVEDVSYWFWGQKDQGQNVLICETSHTGSPWVEDMPVWLCGKKLRELWLVVVVKSQ